MPPQTDWHLFGYTKPIEQLLHICDTAVIRIKRTTRNNGKIITRNIAENPHFYGCTAGKPGQLSAFNQGEMLSDCIHFGNGSTGSQERLIKLLQFFLVTASGKIRYQCTGTTTQQYQQEVLLV